LGACITEPQNVTKNASEILFGVPFGGVAGTHQCIGARARETQRRSAEDRERAVIAFLTICYAAFYWLFFVKLKLFAKRARNIAIFVGIGVVLVGAIVFMWQCG